MLRVAGKYFGASADPAVVTFNFSNGLSLVSNPDKCTTIIGNYAVNGRGSGGDMKGFIEEILLNLKHQDFEGRPNGFNVLNVSEATWQAAGDTWEEINKPWLMRAMERGDAIYAATDPMDLEKVIKDSNLKNSLLIKSRQQLEKVLLSLNELEIDDLLTGYGKEIRLLYQNEYSFNVELKSFRK